ncbi:MAG: RNA-binding domain-containing protein, partial [Acidimicrobiales bacterium]
MDVSSISSEQAVHLLARSEGHFIDNKSIEIGPAKLTKALSAFANADGGELLVGIDEPTPGQFAWRGFARPEDANG